MRHYACLVHPGRRFLAEVAREETLHGLLRQIHDGNADSTLGERRGEFCPNGTGADNDGAIGACINGGTDGQGVLGSPQAQDPGRFMREPDRS